jgi:hypothetical protein
MNTDGYQNVDTRPNPKDSDLSTMHWMSETLKKQMQRINPNANIRIFSYPDSVQLEISDIDLSSLEKLSFKTTNTSNNCLVSLKGMDVYLDDNEFDTLEIPGLERLMKDVWSNSESQAYQSNSITFFPFLKPFYHPTDNKKLISILEYISIQTLMIPWARKANDTVKFKVKLLIVNTK